MYNLRIRVKFDFIKPFERTLLLSAVCDLCVQIILYYIIPNAVMYSKVHFIFLFYFVSNETIPDLRKNENLLLNTT